MTSTTALPQVALEDRIDAFAALCAHHGDGARRLGRALLEQDRADVPDADIDELIGRASAELWPSVASGAVPEAVVRPHLLAAVRRAATPGALPSRVVAAVASLPADAQLELFRVDVEHRPSEAPDLLATARAAIPAALVAAHDGTARRQGCEAARPQLPAYARAKLTPAEGSRVAAHLAVCRPCSAVYLELAEVQSDLPDLLTRAFLGAGAAAYLAGLPPVRPAARLREAVTQSGALRAVGAGVAVLGVVLAGLAALSAGAGPDAGRPDRGPVAAPPVVSTPAPAASTPAQQPVASAGPRDGAATSQPTTGPSSPGPGPENGSGNPHIAPPTQPTQNPGNTQNQPAVTPPSQTPVKAQVDPTAVDLAVRATRSGLGPASVLNLGVAGLGAGQSATLTITADNLIASLQPDPACTLLGTGTASCTITGDHTVSVVSITLLSPTTLTVSAAPDGGLHDSSTADNTTSIPLDGRV